MDTIGQNQGEGAPSTGIKDEPVEHIVALGEAVGLIGPPGSGKSTLLKCLGAVIEPTGGRMTLGDTVIYDGAWKIRDLRALRQDNIGPSCDYKRLGFYW